MQSNWQGEVGVRTVASNWFVIGLHHVIIILMASKERKALARVTVKSWIMICPDLQIYQMGTSTSKLGAKPNTAMTAQKRANPGWDFWEQGCHSRFRVQIQWPSMFLPPRILSIPV